MTVEYNAYLKNLDDDDVLDFKHKLFKLSQLKNALNNAFGSNEKLANELYESLKADGLEINIATIKYNYRGYKNPQKIPYTASNNEAWFREGVEVKVLKSSSGSGWQSGKIKLKVTAEFIPDQPEIIEYESPLDDIRNDPSFSNPKT